MSDQPAAPTRDQFLLWEATSRDILDFKRIYVDITADLNAGLMLSEIIYWYLPNKNNESKLRVIKNNIEWIACHRYEWWDRVRLTPKQADRAIAILTQKGLIEKRIFRFNGEVTPHIRLNWTAFLSLYGICISTKQENPFSPKGKMENNQKAKATFTKKQSPLTESTTETTKDSVAPIVAEVSKTRKPNPWYDAVLSVWKYTGSLNAETCKMLQGKATRKGFKEYNLETPITSEQLLAWAKWYRAEQLHGDTEMNMLENRMKVQSSITGWLAKANQPHVDDMGSLEGILKLVKLS